MSAPYDRARDGRLAWPVLLLFCGLSAAFQLPLPWSDDMSGLNGACYGQMLDRTWVALGLWEIQGQQQLSVVPSDPPFEQADSTYFHHPPAFWWVLHALRRGFDWPLEPWAYRVLPMLLHTLLGLLLVSFVRRSEGGFGALAMALVFATLPATWLYGANVSFESSSCLIGLTGLALHLRLREGRWAWGFVVPLWFALAIWHDWLTSPWVLAILLVELGRPKGDRRPWRAVLAGLGAVAGGGSYFAYLAWLGHDLSGLFGNLRSLAMTTMASHGKLSGGDLEAVIFGHLIVAYGPVALGLAAVCALAWVVPAWRRGGAPEGERSGIAVGAARPGLACSLTGMVLCLILRHHTAVHEFWVVYLLPGVALLLVQLLAALERMAPTGARVALALLLLTNVGAILAGHAQRPYTTVERAEEYASFASPGDLICFRTWGKACIGHLREPFALYIGGQDYALLVQAIEGGLVPWQGFTLILPPSHREVSMPDEEGEWAIRTVPDVAALEAIPGIEHRVLSRAEAPYTCAEFACESIELYRYRKASTRR